MPRIGLDLRRRPMQCITDKDLNIGTWNVASILRPGALDILVDALDKTNMDITAIQETRWPGKDIIQRPTYTFLYSGEQRRYTSGTGFILNKKTMRAVIDWKPVNDRLCLLRLKCKHRNLTLINVHAPTEEKELEIKEEFYEELDRIISQVPARDIKIILGDFNAQAGREAIYRPTIGQHSLHRVTNDNGSRMIGLAASNNLRVGSTFFKHKNIHKGTWKIPGRRTRNRAANQIDHLLIDAQHISKLLDVKVKRGPCADSDHYLLKAKFRQKLSFPTSTPLERTSAAKWNVNKLKENDTRLQYEAEMTRIADQHAPVDNVAVNSLWDDIVRTLEEVAGRTIGTVERVRREKWFDEECEISVRDKNMARQRLLQRHTRMNLQDYTDKRKAQHKLCRKKKREYEKKEVQKVVEMAENKDIRNMYKSVNQLRQEYKPQTTYCRDKQGNILCNISEVLQRWVEHFDELLNVEHDDDSHEEMPIHTAQPLIVSPTYEETMSAINKLKNNKAPGTDNLTAEMFKCGGPSLWKLLHSLIVNIWTQEDLPESWKTGILCPLYKKGDKLLCSNYRGIVLLNVAYKVFANILYNRLLPYSEENIGEYQCGFRKNRSTTDHLFSIRQILEKCYEFNITTHHMFIDFKTAYDKVKREKLWYALNYFGVPAKLISLTKLTLSGVKCKVRIGSNLSDPFETKDGLRQGDGLAQLLFNFILEYAMRNARIEMNGTIYNKSCQILAYADDIDLITRTENSLKENFVAIEQASKNVGLTINEHKTKYLVATRNQQTQQQRQTTITIGDYNIEQVDSFVYLGAEVNQTNDISLEIKRRIQHGNRTFFGLSKLMRSKTISRSLKCTLYKTLIRPVVTYGSESWCMSKEHERQLAGFERKILRRIFGPIQVQENFWRIRYNHELMALYNEPDILNFIKVGRLRWTGHAIRMEAARVPSRLMNANPEGRRSQGGQKKRWLDSIIRDVRTLGIANWRTAALDRPTWKRHLEDAKIHTGL